jgi:ribosomal protein L7/L12
LAVHAAIKKIRVFKLHRSAEAGYDLKEDRRCVDSSLSCIGLQLYYG